jgi:hypothetical protein
MIRENSYIWQINNALNEAISQIATKKNSYLNKYSFFVALGASFEQFCDITIKYSIIKINAI